jgi:hypothetical protein
LINVRALRRYAQESPIVQGKDGLPRVHPGLGAAVECEARAVALSDSLLLSASARDRAIAKPARREPGRVLNAI